jgi:hypothetical protein
MGGFKNKVQHPKSDKVLPMERKYRHLTTDERIQKLLAGNGKELAGRLFAHREKRPGGPHGFGRLGQEPGEHRLPRPGTSKTNGLVEGFNGRIIDWDGVLPVLACSALWAPSLLSGKKGEDEELDSQRLAEITGLKFPIDREERR